MPATGVSSTAVRTEIKISSLSQQLVDALQDAILAGDYQPGQRLVERDLVKQFGVSTIPVREALHELENRGLVVKRPNRGCSVIELSAEEVQSIRELRRVLEPKVMEWAAAHMTRESSAKLSACLSDMSKAADAKDVPAFFRHDLRFHQTIWETAGNKYAAKMLESIVAPLFVTGLIGGHESGKLNLTNEVKKHKQLLKLLLRGPSGDSGSKLQEIASSFEKHLE